MRKIFIGWDAREVPAYEVARASFERHSSRPLEIVPLKLELMRQSGFLWQGDNDLDDIFDEVSPSTDFGRTRFLVPYLQRRGWALYCDCDVVAHGDVEDLFKLARLDPSYAVYVVKHEQQLASTKEKMDGRAQRAYPRKNWSSVMLWNCEHPAHRRLTLQMINEWPRRMLHQFAWLEDHQIYGVPAEWNWLVGVQDKPANPKLAHFTLGGPWLRDWQPREHDDLWLAEAAKEEACKAAV